MNKGKREWKDERAGYIQKNKQKYRDPVADDSSNNKWIKSEEIPICG
jgi:hypothetical protein